MTFLISNPFTWILYDTLVFLNDAFARVDLPASVSSYAIAITLIAILIKLVTYPLTRAQQSSMRAMQALQPKLKELQTRHADDREKLAQAQMDMYREHGVNPLGGCLPLVIQMVVLFGLYRAISQLADEGKLAGARFLWIPDLGKCEPSPLCDAQLSVMPVAIPIMVILLIVSQMAYQRYLTPPATDPQAQMMASMTKWMPLLFAYIFLYLPAGLVLYYTAFNVVSVAQYLAIDRRMALPPGLAEATSDSAEPAGEPAGRAATPKDRTHDDVDARRQRRRKRRN